MRADTTHKHTKHGYYTLRELRCALLPVCVCIVPCTTPSNNTQRAQPNLCNYVPMIYGPFVQRLTSSLNTHCTRSTHATFAIITRVISARGRAPNARRTSTVEPSSLTTTTTAMQKLSFDDKCAACVLCTGRSIHTLIHTTPRARHSASCSYFHFIARVRDELGSQICTIICQCTARASAARRTYTRAVAQCALFAETQSHNRTTALRANTTRFPHDPAQCSAECRVRRVLMF